MKHPTPFAHHGSEKMIYDVRMGPQALFRDGKLWVAYLANPEGSKALPHIIWRNQNGKWSDPVVLGEVANYDHHYAPVMWFDDAAHLHVLYHCHFGLNESRHLVSAAPLDATRWTEAPAVAPSISYPRLLRMADNKLVLYYRALGHMGYWTYRISGDGGYTWDQPVRAHVDFDHLPENPGDEWAGTYHSIALSRYGKSLHVAFVYWDERELINPLYGRSVGLLNRYNLYYLRLELLTGRIFTVDGAPLELPLNRKNARRCLVLETGDHLSNMPSLCVDENDSPSFLVPLSEDAIDHCRFWYIRRTGQEWTRHPVTETSNTWNGSHLELSEDGSLSAFLIGKAERIEDSFYGGGPLQEWRSTDQGATWKQIGDLTPQPGLLCNNPRPVESAEGTALKRNLIFYGWEGPEGLVHDRPFTGGAYLWRDGTWL